MHHYRGRLFRGTRFASILQTFTSTPVRRRLTQNWVVRLPAGRIGERSGTRWHLYSEVGGRAGWVASDRIVRPRRLG